MMKTLKMEIRFLCLAWAILAVIAAGHSGGAGVACAFSLSDAFSLADESDGYHTPLAGEKCDIECMGRKVSLPQRNRENTEAVVFGGSIFTPELAGHVFVPIGALYYKHRWDDTRVRGTFSIFVNDLDASKSLGKFQLLGHLDNTTIPFARSEIDNGSEVDTSAIKWGTADGRLGVGWRLPVAPFQSDNDLKLQFFFQAGYLYSQRVTDTGANVVLPPNTMVYGPLLRMRYDSLRRNLMELPHQGIASGMDAEFSWRAKWSDANYGGPVYTEDETRKYLKLSGYLVLATGVPWLSERNRLLVSFYGGFAPYGTLDRFSAFRIGGGPVPSESDDLERQVFPGAMFGQFPTSQYLISSLEYRREIFSFLYFHLRGTHAWVKRELFGGGPAKFQADTGDAYSATLTSGFLWDSELHLEYSYDTIILRNGSTGSNIIVMWSKSF
jgi:hypothetical protein